MARKSSNPFKLWGSYIGLVIFLVPSLIAFFILAGLAGGFGSSVGLGDTLMILVPLPTIGFLIGYIVHILIRSMREH